MGASGSKEEAPAKQQEGHKVPKSSVVSDANVDEEVKAFQQHQKDAARLSFPDEARTLVDLGRFAVISTVAAGGGDAQGFPSGSIVGFASKSDDGLPVFAFSTLSSHTGDIDADPRCSLTVTAPGFKGAADGRVTLSGRVFKVPEARLAAAKEAYKAKHPTAFWIDFGDFTMYEMTELVHVRLVGGFARAGNIKADQYLGAKVDPVAQYSAPICKHMNDDHLEEVSKYVTHYAGITVEAAKMLTVDHLGMTVEAQRDGQTFKVRLPFPEPARDRKAVKDQVVAMSRAAAAAAAKKAEAPA